MSWGRKSPGNGSGGAPQVFPEHHFLLHRTAKVLVGSAISEELNTNQQPIQGMWSQQPAAQGDKWEYRFPLKSGSYTLLFRGVQFSNMGILTVRFNGVQVATFDFFNSTATFSVDYSVSVTHSADGEAVIEGEVQSKNASSTGFSIQISYLVLQPS